jgi:hypothetical protein
MKIDKTRFILLTTTLAASTTAALVACTVNSTNTTTNTGTDAGQATSSSGSSGQGSSSGGTSSGGTSSGGTTCLGDTGDKAACGNDAGVYDDGGLAAKCPVQCESHNDWFKTAVAKSIHDCLEVLPSAEACDTSAPDCANKAIDQACDDTTAAEWCTNNVKCPGGVGVADAGGYGGGGDDPQAACVKIVRALSARGRETLKACFETAGGVCAEGALVDCFDGLKVGQTGAP